MSQATTKMNGKNCNGNKNSSKVAVTNGCLRMTVQLAATLTAISKPGVYGKTDAKANAIAVLEKTAGKIFPPRHPNEKQTWVKKAFPTAMLIKKKTD